MKTWSDSTGDETTHALVRVTRPRRYEGVCLSEYVFAGGVLGEVRKLPRDVRSPDGKEGLSKIEHRRLSVTVQKRVDSVLVAGDFCFGNEENNAANVIQRTRAITLAGLDR